MKKQTLIFDASVISENLGAGRGRSGIYFAANNVLKNLIDSGRFDISLYSTIDSVDFIEFVKRECGDNVNIYYANRYAMFLSKMSELDNKLRANKHNIVKLLLQVFVRRPVKFIGQNVRIPNFDIAFSPMGAFPKIVHANRRYILLHDVIPLVLPEYYLSVKLKKHWFCGLVDYIESDSGCKYFANSNATKADFVKYLNVNPDDVIVTPLAANDGFYHVSDNKKIAKVRAKYNVPAGKKYVFSLCTLEPRKNLIRAVRTFIEFIKKNKIDDMVFVLGGAHWDEFIGKLENEIVDLGKYKNKIIRAGYVDDADLPVLYSGAEWFVYTSQYEGFGLPPLEAMKCGCPVITSNNSSLPEVVGDAGLMIDWDSDEQHIAAYEKYYNDKKFRDAMVRRGLKRAAGFSWRKTVDAMIREMTRD